MAKKAGLLLAALTLIALTAVIGNRLASGTRDAADTTAAPATASSSGAGAPAGPTSASATHTVDAAGRSGAAASVTADPMSGQVLATDPPVVVTTSAVPVSVTFFGWDPDTRRALVGGYAAGVVEGGGTCTLTLTKGAATAAVTAQATADASTTTCGAVTVPGDELSAGTWQAVLSYRSARHTGAAAPVSIEVTP